MTNKEILKRALEKAIKNSEVFAMRMGKYKVESRYGWLDGAKQEEPYIKQYFGKIYEREISWQVIVFYHDFAKALWGESPSCGNPNCPDCPGIWTHRLQDLVIAEDPFNYLKEYIA